MARTKSQRENAVEVSLTAAEQKAAQSVRRRWQDYAKGRERFKAGHGDDGATRRAEGAMAEQAVAQYFGGAVPAGVRVRYSAQANAQLVVGDGKPDDAWFLVTGRAGSYRIEGWCWGHEREDRGAWRDDVPHPAWFVDDLRAVADFTTGKAVR